MTIITPFERTPAICSCFQSLRTPGVPSQNTTCQTRQARGQKRNRGGLRGGLHATCRVNGEVIIRTSLVPPWVDEAATGVAEF